MWVGVGDVRVSVYGTFRKELDDERRSNCMYGDRPGIDRCMYGVRTGDVCAYAFFSLADTFAIGYILISDAYMKLGNKDNQSVQVQVVNCQQLIDYS